MTEILMHQRHRTSITDVAREAGVGIGSVSRVINNVTSVTQAMRWRVQQAMEKLGYIPDAPANRPGPKRPRGRRSAERGAIVDLVVHNIIVGLGWMDEQTPVYASVFEGIEEELQRTGKQLRVRLQSDAVQEQAPPIGRILFGSDPSPLLPDRARRRVPETWVLGIPPVWFVGDHVTIDNRAVGEMAAIEAKRLGHSQAIFLGSCLGSSMLPVGYRADAFSDYFTKFGGRVDMIIDPGIIRTDHTSNKADDVLIDNLLTPFLQRPDRATVICVQADMLVPGVYACLDRLCIKPQVDMTVISCNNEIRYHRGLRPRPLVIDVLAKEIGRQAVKTTLERIECPDSPFKTVAVRPLFRN
jgi:DNA-binding LacI/PurR family transcriptional regulator